jgi:hypothetical protein
MAAGSLFLPLFMGQHQLWDEAAMRMRRVAKMWATSGSSVSTAILLARVYFVVMMIAGENESARFHRIHGHRISRQVLQDPDADPAARELALLTTRMDITAGPMGPETGFELYGKASLINDAPYKTLETDLIGILDYYREAYDKWFQTVNRQTRRAFGPQIVWQIIHTRVIIFEAWGRYIYSQLEPLDYENLPLQELKARVAEGWDPEKAIVHESARDTVDELVSERDWYIGKTSVILSRVERVKIAFIGLLLELIHLREIATEQTVLPKTTAEGSDAKV